METAPLFSHIGTLTPKRYMQSQKALTILLLKRNQGFYGIIYKEFLLLMVASFRRICTFQEQSAKKVYIILMGPEKPPYMVFSIS